MKDLVSLLEAGDTCGYCERSWGKCDCLSKFGDDYWGDGSLENHEQRRLADWQLYKIWSY